MWIHRASDVKSGLIKSWALNPFTLLLPEPRLLFGARWPCLHSQRTPKPNVTPKRSSLRRFLSFMFPSENAFDPSLPCLSRRRGARADPV